MKSSGHVHDRKGKCTLDRVDLDVNRKMITKSCRFRWKQENEC
jgi:hypothetical protein